MQEVTRAEIKNRKKNKWVNVWLRDGLHRCCWAVTFSSLENGAKTRSGLQNKH